MKLWESITILNVSNIKNLLKWTYPKWEECVDKYVYTLVKPVTTHKDARHDVTYI